MARLPASCTAVLLILVDQAAVTGEDLKRLVSAWRRQPDSIAAGACGAFGDPDRVARGLDGAEGLLVASAIIEQKHFAIAEGRLFRFQIRSMRKT